MTIFQLYPSFEDIGTIPQLCFQPAIGENKRKQSITTLSCLYFYDTIKALPASKVRELGRIMKSQPGNTQGSVRFYGFTGKEIDTPLDLTPYDYEWIVKAVAPRVDRVGFPNDGAVDPAPKGSFVHGRLGGDGKQPVVELGFTWKFGSGRMGVLGPVASGLEEGVGLPDVTTSSNF
ncbi:hypothetical protein T439DRAFT_34158 [Meredithblackwellia eburnea MCA 4105]